jgi:hypothetical protein
MATYDSEHVNQPGQYPTTAWTEFELPEQNFGSGAAGTVRPSSVEDEGNTNQAGQYPDRDDFTGVPYSLGGPSGSGAPGSAGIAYDGQGGPDTVTYDKPEFYKGQHDDGAFDEADGRGNAKNTIQATVSGQGDWTQANPEGYLAPAQFQMPGVAGNTPAPGDSARFQTDAGPNPNSSGHVMYGGFLNGDRPSTSRHPGFSGPGS